MQTARPIRRAARMQRNSQASMHINSSTAGSGTICLRKRHGLLQKRSWMSIVSDPNLPQQPSLPSQGPSPAGDAENLHVLVAEPVHEEFIGGMDQIVATTIVRTMLNAGRRLNNRATNG